VLAGGDVTVLKSGDCGETANVGAASGDPGSKLQPLNASARTNIKMDRTKMGFMFLLYGPRANLCLKKHQTPG
jgi:hypothetical protein